MNPTYLSPFANHLWQSTVFAGIAGLLTLALGRNRARVRYWVWLTASSKFLLPLSLLMALGSHIEWRTAPEIARFKVSVAMEKVSQPFTPLAEPSRVAEAVPAAASHPTDILWGIWACGFLGIATAWFVRWRRFRAAISRGTPIQLALPLPVVCAPTIIEPGVFGIFRPVLALPEGIFARLTPAQLEAVIAHELSHVRQRDNLIAAVHMFVETVFWFYPLVWWIGKRMVEERERACDEEVLQLGSEPRVYAEGILGICKLYVESPMACVSGVTGANLKKRIEAIMKNRAALRLDFARKAVLAAAGLAAIAIPLAMGILNAGEKRLTFDTASVKATSLAQTDVFDRAFWGIRTLSPTGGPGTDDPGRIHYPPASLKELLDLAWDSYDLVEGPDWLDSQFFAVEATMPPNTSKAQVHEMLRNLIVERFGLRYHAVRKEIAGYALTIARNGPKLNESEEDPRPTSGLTLEYPGMTMPQLAAYVSSQLHTFVIDATGLKGKYYVHLAYGGQYKSRLGSGYDIGYPLHPDIFEALEAQLGLKLEHEQMPEEVLVVDHVGKTPTGK